MFEKRLMSRSEMLEYMDRITTENDALREENEELKAQLSMLRAKMTDNTAPADIEAVQENDATDTDALKEENAQLREENKRLTEENARLKEEGAEGASQDTTAKTDSFLDWLMKNTEGIMSATQAQADAYIREVKQRFADKERAAEETRAQAQADAEKIRADAQQNRESIEAETRQSVARIQEEAEKLLESTRSEYNAVREMIDKTGFWAKR